MLLFDLDGTLVDSSGDIAEILSRMFAESGLDAPSRSEVVRWIGDGAVKLIERGFDFRGVAVPSNALERFHAHHDACFLASTRPYPGIPELLEALSSQCRMAVVTNKPAALARQVVAGTGLDRWLPLVIGPEDVEARKPSGRHVLGALDRMDARPDEAIMIGDGTTDLRAGREAGCLTLAVLWGYRQRDELAAEEPDAWAADVDELRRLLLEDDSVERSRD